MVALGLNLNPITWKVLLSFVYTFFTNHFQNCSLLIGEQNEAIEVDLEVTEVIWRLFTDNLTTLISVSGIFLHSVISIIVVKQVE